MFLYASGCSMTFGSEMLHPDDRYVLNNPVLNAKRLDQAWPGVVANLLGFEGHHNDGKGGISNEYIMRSTIHWVLNTDIPYDQLCVHVSWTQHTRWEFLHGIDYDAVFVDQHPDILNSRHAFFKRFWLNFQERVDPIISWTKFTQQVAMMQAFLTNLGIAYSMSYGVNSPIDDLRKHIRDIAEYTMLVQKTTHLIDKSRFLGFLSDDSSMCNHIWNSGITRDQLAPRGHPYADGHAIWGNHVANWIEENNLMEAP